MERTESPCGCPRCARGETGALKKVGDALGSIVREADSHEEHAEIIKAIATTLSLIAVTIRLGPEEYLRLCADAYQTAVIADLATPREN